MKKSYFYLVFLMPIFLIALMKLCPTPAVPNPKEKAMSTSEERALAAEERRAERREAREARKAERAAKATAAQQNMAPDFGGMAPFPMEPGMGFGDFPAPTFDPGMNFDNTMAMTPGMGFGGGFGGPGMGFGGGFGGF